MKILTHKLTGQVRVIGNYGVTERFATRQEALKDYQRIKRNALKREQSQLLRDLTGTSAKAARLDMGL